MIARMLLSIFIIVIVGCQQKQAPTAEVSPTAKQTEVALAVTVSGLSSGGYMAVQMHVAHSATVSGVGMIAAGPYGCSLGELPRALGACTKGGGIDVTVLTERAVTAAQEGRIDALTYLASSPVWLFHGSNDDIVAADVVSAAQSFYQVFVAKPTQVAYVSDVPAGHGFPVDSEGDTCASLQAPFLNACEYDAAGALLAHITGATGKVASGAKGILDSFVQPAANGLASQGLVYTPPQCAAGEPCDLHVVFHGCSQGQEFVGESFARDAGYNRWADALSLIVIYPQVQANPFVNPLGCWDWWGYTGADFDSQNGVQVQAVKTLIEGFQDGSL